ncbi:MAG: ABC transporter permease [Ferruginibacter sp.]
MLKNYFKIAIRNLRRNKILSFVNIAGLAIGLACVILITLFVKDEWSFDKFHKNGENIYRLVQTTTDTSGKEMKSGNTGLPRRPVFAAEIPEIESFCRIKGWDMTTRKANEGLEAKVLFADPSIFSIFTIDIQQGNAAAMLKGRNSVVLTDATATKYFGSENPLGKTVEIEVDEALEPFMVTGVVKKPALNSSIQFDMLIPFERQNPTDATELNQQMSNWGNLYLNTFFLLRKDADVKAVEKKLWAVYLNHNGENWKKFQQRNGNAKRQYLLQPFFAIHLDKTFFASNGLSSWSDSTYSYILSGLAILVLIIACINFINITLARGMQRCKEVGIRKVSGSTRWQVVSQFLIESFVVTALAFIAALLLVRMLLPLMNDISHKHFDFTYLVQPGTVIIFIAMIIMVSILAGFYPAFIASGFQPVQTLYSRLKLSGKNLLGKSLVVLQFVIAVALIISTIIFSRQFNYISKTDLGYNAQNMIHMQFPWGKPNELQQLKNTLLQNPAIQSVGTKSGDRNSTSFEINGKQTDWCYYEHIDDSYLQAMQIPLAKGRYLSYTNVADTVSNCMVNEAFVETYLDKSKDPIGQTIGQGDQVFSVIGIVKNYHSADLKEKIAPVFFSLDKYGDLLNTYIKYVPGKETAAADALSKAYKSILPYSTLEYYFMQDWLMLRYEEDAQWKKIISSAALIAILISALGLFALTTLSVQQRIKEIGIRKVLGASVANITAILSKDFLKLVCIALLIGSPIAWWAMNKWLQDFAYRINISWWIFGLAGLIILTIAFITVSFQAIKAAIANPVKSLRTE